MAPSPTLPIYIFLFFTIQNNKAPSNQAVATFTLAVNRNFKNQSTGEREADFINCVMWRQQAENLANWTKKGHLIGVTGRIQTRSYDNQQGQRVYVTGVVAESFQLLEKRDNAGNHTYCKTCICSKI